MEDTLLDLWPKPKRIAELKDAFQVPAGITKNRNTVRSASATKNSARKPDRLTQIMSTSKKRTLIKQLAHSTSKRAIDFNKSNFQTDNANWNVKPITSRHTYAPMVNKEPTMQDSRFDVDAGPSVKSVKKSVPLKTPGSPKRHSVVDLSSRRHILFKVSPKNGTASKKNRRPLSSIRLNYETDPSSQSDSSDKENDGRDVGEMARDRDRLAQRAGDLLRDHRTMADDVDSLSGSSDPADLQRRFVSLSQRNFKITSEMIQLFLKSLEINMEMFNLLANSTGRVGNGNCTKKPRESDDDATAEDSDLRKMAIKNSQLQKMMESAGGNAKQSDKIYESMKSNMNFLKTPKRENSDLMTPNTKSRNTTRNNLQRQLQSLFD